MGSSLRRLNLLILALHAAAMKSLMIVHALRLMPGDDLVESILDYCQAHALGATTIVSCVGSLSRATLRLAAAQEICTYEEELEIVSLVGTVGRDRAHHLHCSLSRRDGSVIGGHCKGAAHIRTTAEVMLGELPELEFTRTLDPATGYQELQIQLLTRR